MSSNLDLSVPNPEAGSEDMLDELIVFPMSYGQQRMWFLDQFQPGSPFYNIPSAIRLSGALDVAALRRALDEIVARHEALRTTFGRVEGEPSQVIAPSLRLNAPLIDLSALADTEREAEALRLAREEARQPFDLTKGPLLRARLIRLAPEEHLALITMHHIVSDGWSMSLFVRELSVLYSAFLGGRPSPLAPLPIQYADYAEWQREWLQGEVLQGEIAFWKEKLGNPPPPVLELPGDRPRPAVQTANGSTLHTKLPRSVSDQVQALGRQEGATVFMTLLAAFNALLYRYTGHTDICVGTPIANRRQAELEPLIGLFINTLVLRTQLDGDMTFRELLRRVKNVALEGYAHQDLPFEMIVDALQPDRDMSHSTLFQVMFILQNAGLKAQSAPGLSLKMVEVDAGTSTFDLTLNCSEQTDGLATSLEYNTDIFDRATIQRLLGHFETLLTAALDRPDTPLALLPLLGAAERERMLVEWNATGGDVAPGGAAALCIHDLIEAQAAETPDALAVIVPEIAGRRAQSITYAELDRRANQLASALSRIGIGPESTVAVSAEKSVEMIVGLLGVLKAGAAYLPIDPNYPAERIRHMLSDSGASVLLTQWRLLTQLPLDEDSADRSALSHVLCLDADWPSIGEEPATKQEVGVRPDNLAYVIYTSGSTGQSKGVLVEHRNLVNAYYAWEGAYALKQPVKTHLQMASFSFDVFTGDLVRGLCSGGTLVLAPRELLLQPAELYALMQQTHVTCAEFVPGVLRPLMQHLDDTGQKLDFMQVLACGSDSWYMGEYARFLRFCGPDTRLINSFGLTETTIDTCYYETRSDGGKGSSSAALGADQIVPIGRPFANQRMYVLDPHGQPMPVGVPGELYIGGAGVARGYHNRPDLTAEKFLPDPFSGLSGSRSRVYRTGDLARYLPDGNVQFLGRADNQVKIRGYRIEPGEIEAALDRHDALAACAVTAPTDPKGQHRLVAYYVVRRSAGWGAEAKITASDLRRFLQDRVPDYMVPSFFVELERLPLTPNGKVDRRVLPPPDWSQRAAEEVYVAPRTPTEMQMAAVWSAVLGVEQVGAFDNFFELGGHSLLATQLASRIRTEFKVELPLRNIFEAPTIAGLAEQIDARRARPDDAVREAPPVVPVPRPVGPDGTSRAPLSFAQQRLWFLDQLEPNSPFYNIPEAIRLRGALDTTALARALAALIRRHDALRTSFASANGIPEQVIAPLDAGVRVDLPVEDLSGLPRAEREAAVLRAAAEEAQKPFDLSTAPLMRARLVRLAPDDHAFLLTTHHIISDNWSSGILVREMAALYDGATRFSPSQTVAGSEVASLADLLPPLPIQYPDFAEWQRAWLQGEVLAEQIDYWKQKLSGAPPLLELPTDRPRPPVQTFNGAYQSFSLPKDFADGVRGLCQREGVTPFMALLAAFQALLSRYSGQDDIVVGSPIANRTRGELEGIVGFFVNTLVLRTDLSGDPTFRELLRRSKETTLGAYAHQDTPFEMIVDALNPQRNLGHSPLFQVMLVLQQALGQQGLGQNAPQSGEGAGGARGGGSGLTLSEIAAHSGTSKFDLTLFMVDTGGVFSGAVEYNTDLFDGATIARFIEHFEILLRGITADAGLPVSALPLMSEAETRYLLDEWNATAADYPRELRAHQLIEAHVAANPDAPAVFALSPAGPPASLTYQELDARANQLARRLRRLGVGVDSLVAISLERGLELPVAMLGVLKAGAGYVPLDPAYPIDRLGYMLQDCGAAVLLTQDRLADRLAAADAARIVIRLDTDWPDIATESAERVENLARPESLAYAIYTSGSTGRPKGTLIHHDGLVNYLTWCRRAYPLGQGTGAPVHSSISFDLTVTSLLAPLATGKAVYLLPEGLAVDLLTETLRAQGHGGDDAFSLIKITPAHLQLIGQQLAPDEAAGRTHAFIIGGENLLAEHVAFWHQNAPQTRLINEYGPTETVVGCCVYEVPGGAELGGSVAIGRPIINTRLYVLDKALRPVPIGVPGELYIGGAGVARGYHNRPELTAERFLPDPFAPAFDHPGISGTSAARMYRTGDAVRLRADGNLEYLGRLDEQIKIRGFRVELGEIEGVLTEHRAIKEAAVVTRLEAGDKRLAAFVVFEAASGATAADLRAFLARRLPDYMVPAAYTVLPALPLTANGKVDRRALAQAEGQALGLEEGREASYLAPSTATEEILAGIWSDLLRVERIGAADSFFDLGGHSLLATQLVSRIRDAFGVELPLRALFEAPVLANLAAGVDRAAANRRQSAAPKLAPAPRTGEPLPLSFGQQRFWFLDRLERAEEGGNPFYNIPSAIRLRGSLSVDALRYAFEEIVRRHEVLRTTFAEEGGRPVPVVAPAGEASGAFSLTQVDLADVDPDEREERMRGLARLEAVAPFDLATGPLMRGRLLRLAGDEHVLLLTMHHIVSDAWSNNVLVRELSAFYTAYLDQRPAGLPPLPVQYADYAAWQRSWLQGDVLQTEVDYWREELRGLPPLLELPLDRPRPSVQTYRGASVPFALPKDVSDGLRALGRREGATAYMSLLAGFETLLHRYTGQDEIPVGAPIANRTRGETEGLIGFFVNTLVMRGRCGGNPSFRQLLARVKETALGAYAHQDLPFEMLVDGVQTERSLSYSPLFQVLFNLQSSQAGPATPGRPGANVAADPGGRLQLETLELGSSTSPYDLTLSMVESPAGFAGTFEYNVDLFDEATIQRMAGHLQQLLAAAAADPDRPIGALPLLTPEEQAQLAAWNATAAPLPDRPIHAFFEDWAARTPNAPAAVFVAGAHPPVAYTYAELNARANRLAHYLIAHGVGRETLVGISVTRSLDQVVALLATLKAGAAYLPLDPNYPPDRRHFMLADAGVTLVLTQAHLLAAEPPAEPLAVTHFCLDRDWDQLAGYPDTTPALTLSGEHLAYVIYTSGSTGRPKGVLVAHRGLTNLVRAQTAAFGITPADRILQFASFSFDAAVSETFMALAAGATLYLAPQTTLAAPPELTRLLQDYAISAVTLPPSLLALLDPAGLDDLQCLISAGERLPAAVAARWAPGRRLFNAYGPTEATIGPTLGRVAGLPAGAASAPVGRPIANIAIHLRDRYGNPVPVGVPGELCVAGAGLARGYLGRPDLTAERFVPLATPDHECDEFGQLPATRLYRTGDLARYLPDGQLEILGRLDQQVKLRGFRIELGEIEAVLRELPGVADAVALVQAETPGDPAARLVAYLVAAGSTSGAAGDWRAHLRARLPEYMLPAAFVLLDAFPLTPNGKVDRAALRRHVPEWSGSPDTQFSPPSTATEIRLAELWVELLHVERVGQADTFFDLGGHSLLATQLISRVRDAFGVELPLRALFEAPSLTGFAEALDRQAMHGPAGETATGIRPVPRPVREDGGSRLPLSFAQQRLWFLDRLEPDSPLYNLPTAMRLRGELDRAALERALQEIVRRHEVLRTTFHTVDGEPVQFISPPETTAQLVSLTFDDLSALSEERREQKARGIVQTEAQAPFSLQEGPLVRGRVVRLGDGPDGPDHLVLLNMHHIVSDGWSLGVLTRELAALYTAFAQGRPSPLRPAAIQYADYAFWQRAWLEGRDPERILGGEPPPDQPLPGSPMQRQLDYWRAELEGLPDLLELPLDRPRPPVQTYRGNTIPISLPVDLSARITALAHAEGATPFMALLAGFETLLHRYSNQDDIAVGTPIANRTQGLTEDLIGFFVNTLVMRGRCGGNPSFRQLVGRVKETALGAYAHQDLPFEMLVDALTRLPGGPARNLSHSPVFQVVFTMQNMPGGSMNLPGLTLLPVEMDAQVAKFDLTLSMVESPAGFAGTFEYNVDLFDEATIRRMAGHLQQLLAAAAADPDRPIGALPLLTPEEQVQLAAWNATAAPLPDRPIHAFFEDWAARTPDAPAAVFVAGAHPPAAYTYAELNARANRLAHYLIAHGAGRANGVDGETLVGISVTRSLDQVVALLATLKAGAAYLPLDPNYPPDRRHFMLADAGVTLVLTQAHLLAAEPLAEPPSATHFCLDRDWDQLAGYPDTTPALTLSGEHLAYVIYTSGSTGRPKGVLVAHRGLTNLVRAQTAAFGITPADRILQFASFSFDAAVSETFMALAAGATLYLAPQTTLAAPPELTHLLQDYAISAVTLPPSLLALLDPAGLDDLQCLISAGERLPAAVAARWAPGRRLFNAYGPTEATIGPTLGRVADLTAGAASAPVGRPIANIAIHLRDRYGNPVPVGVPGELCVAGAGLARGYLGRPDLTAERFVPLATPDHECDEFGQPRATRLYRTGDLARYLPDGQLEILGRLDQQVKLRGFRIELGEIEAVLRELPGVADAVALVQAETPGDPAARLVAYLVAADSTSGAASDWRAYLRARLPEYMLPAAFVLLDAFPLTPNGKVDRAALQNATVPGSEWRRDERAGDAAFVGPRDPLETQLAAIFEDVLAMHGVGVLDSFFDLGGHSLLAVKLVARIGAELGIPLPLAALFERPTVEHLAKVIREQYLGGFQASLVPIKPDGDRPALFFIHPSGGSVHWYYELAQRLPEDRPLYGLQAHGLMGDADLDETVEAMAERYVAEIRQVQPEGPYHIASWSMGVAIALEVGQQLARQGAQMGLLVAIDQGPISPDEEPQDDAEYLMSFFGRRMPVSLEYLRTLEGDEQLRYIMEEAKRIEWLFQDVTFLQFKQFVSVLKTHVRAWRAYVPAAYDGRVVVFRAMEREGEPGEAPDLGWRALAGPEVEVCDAPGNHNTVLHEHAEEFAEVLLQRIAAFEAEEIG